MLQEYNIKGTPEVYTIALRSCSLTGDLGFALKIYEDMNKIGVKPDEVHLLVVTLRMKILMCSLHFISFSVYFMNCRCF